MSFITFSSLESFLAENKKRVVEYSTLLKDHEEWYTWAMIAYEHDTDEGRREEYSACASRHFGMINWYAEEIDKLHIEIAKQRKKFIKYNQIIYYYFNNNLIDHLSYKMLRFSDYPLLAKEMIENAYIKRKYAIHAYNDRLQRRMLNINYYNMHKYDYTLLNVEPLTDVEEEDYDYLDCEIYNTSVLTTAYKYTTVLNNTKLFENAIKYIKDYDKLHAHTYLHVINIVKQRDPVLERKVRDIIYAYRECRKGGFNVIKYVTLKAKGVSKLALNSLILYMFDISADVFKEFESKSIYGLDLFAYLSMISRVSYYNSFSRIRDRLRDRLNRELRNRNGLDYVECELDNFVFESAVSKPLADDTVSNDTEGNVTLAVTGEPACIVASIPETINWGKLTSTDIQDSLDHLVDRWMYDSIFQWTAQQSMDVEIIKRTYPYDFVYNSYNNAEPCNAPNTIPFKVHAYWRGDIKIRVQINSNKFQVGQLQVSFLYNDMPYDNYIDMRTNIYTLSQSQHEIISAGSSNEVELFIPYKNYAPYIHSKSRPDNIFALGMGTLRIRVLSPLSVPTGGPSECNGTIFIKFSNCVFTGMIDGSVNLNSVDDSEIVVRPESGILGNMALNLLNSYVDKNRDKPSDPSPSVSYVPTASQSWCAGTGIVEPLESLRLDPRGTVPHPGLESDEMGITNICSKYGLLFHAIWSKNHTYGTMLLDIPVTPSLPSNYFKSFSRNSNSDEIYLKSYAMPPVSVITGLFNYWRGSIKYRFDFVCSQYHVGRVLCAYIPGKSSRGGVSISQARCSPHVVFSLQDQNSFTFEVPYVANTPFWQKWNNGNYTAASVDAPSRLVMFVLNPLIPMQNVIESINIMVYMAGGVDFEVAVPVQPSIGLCWNSVVRYSTQELVFASTSSDYPYYPGTYYNFLDSKALVLRSKTTSGGVAYFNVDDLEKIETIAHYYETTRPGHAGTYIDKNNKVKDVIFCIAVMDGAPADKHWMFAVCSSEDSAKSASLDYHIHKIDLQKLLNDGRLESADKGTTTNRWSDGDPGFIVHKAVAFSFEGGRERDGIIMDPSISNPYLSKLLFGESFLDLKDLCRRYQYYCGFKTDLSKLVSGQCSQIIPIYPQGMALNLTGKNINEVWNRCRDGHINIVASGYRFFRGSIRFKFVITSKSKYIGVWVQLRTDRAARYLNNSDCKDISTAEAVINHGYSMYLQLTSVNGIITFEVPFYVPSLYTLTQIPKLTLSERYLHFVSMGELVVGFNLSDEERKLETSLTCDVYYSLGDDARYSTFQGFPPMVLLDDISDIKENNNSDSISEISDCILVSPESGVFKRLFKSGLNSVKEDIHEEIVKPVITDIETAMNDIKNQLAGTKLEHMLDNSVVRNLITNFVHCIINPTIRAIVWAIVSILCEIGIVSITAIEFVIDKFTKFIEKIKSTSEQDIVEKAEEAAEITVVPESGTQQQNEAALGFITLIWSLLSSFLSYKGSKPATMSDWSKFLLRDMKSVFQSSNALFSFIRNLMSVLQSMYTFIVSKTHRDITGLELLRDNHSEVKAWIEEVNYLNDPEIRHQIEISEQLQNRVYLCYAHGTMFVSGVYENEDVKCLALIINAYSTITKLKNDLVSNGIDCSVRKLPFTMYVHGEPGIGKSEMLTDVCASLLKSIQYKITTGLMCIVNPTDQYWSQLNRQPVLCVDDIFAVRTPEMLSQQLALLFSVVSPVPLTPPMAALEDKKIRYNPEICVLNSNLAFPRFEGVNEDAIWRRRDVLIDVRLIDYDTEKKLNCEHCNKRLKPCDAAPSDLQDYHHLRFRFAYSVKDPNTTYTPWLDYDNFIGILTNKFRANRIAETERFERRVRTINELIGENDHGINTLEQKLNLIQDQKEVYNRKTLYNTVFGDIHDFIIDSKNKLFVYFSKYISDMPTIEDYKVNYLNIISNPYVTFESPECASTSQEDDDIDDESLIVNMSAPSNFKATYIKLHNYFTGGIILNTPLTKRYKKLLKMFTCWHEDGYINDKMFKILVSALQYENSIDQVDISSMSIFKVFEEDIKVDLLKYNYGSRTIDHILNTLIWLPAMENSYMSSFCCGHSGVFVEKAIYSNSRKTIIYNGRDISDVCDRFCILKCPLIFYMYWRRWLISNPVYLHYYQRKQFDKLPSLYAIEQLDFPDQQTWTSQISTTIQILYDKYLKGPFGVIHKFFKNIWPILAFIIGIISMMALACGSAIVIDNMCEKNKSTVAVWGESNKAYAIKPSRSIAPKVSIPVVCQSASQQSEVVKNRIKENVFIITAIDNDKSVQYTCLCIKMNQILILRHYLDEMMRMSPNAIYYGNYLYSKHECNQYGVLFNLRDCDVKWFKTNVDSTSFNSNFGLLTIPPLFPMRKSLVKFIAPAQHHSRVSGMGELIDGDKIIINLPLKRNKKVHVIPGDDCYTTIRVDDVYTYPVHGRGMCGSVLISPNLESPIIGMHFAGSTSGIEYGLSELLTREMFDTVTTSLPYENFLVPNLKSIDLSKVNLKTAIFPYGTVTPQYATAESGKTAYTKSLIHGCVPVLTEPNPLSPYDLRLPKGSNPLRDGCEHMGKPPLCFDESKLELCTKHLKRKLLGVVVPMRPTVNLLSYDEVVCGIPSLDGYEPINLNTSAGFPLSSIKPKDGIGKRWLFDINNDKCCLNKMHPELYRLLELEYNMRKSKIKPFTVFSDCLKDTCVAVEKCHIPGKTRIFSISPIQFTIAFKQYFNDFVAGYQNARFDAETGIGITCDSYEWTILAELLQKYGDKIICGDYKNFGPGLMKSCVRQAFSIILDWYRKYDNNDERMLIREILAEEIIDSYHLCSNLIYQTPCGIPSGSPITTPLNSIVNSLYIRYVYNEIVKDNFVRFDNELSVVTYGDDVCIGCSDDLIKIFNTRTMSDIFLKYNIVFTDIDKSDQIVEYRSLETAEFLKRKFVKHPYRDVFLAPLEVVSIEGCVNWIHKKGNLVENSIENCNQALELAYGRGIEYYDKLYAIIVENFKLKSVNYSYLMWEALDVRIFGVNVINLR